MSERRYWECDDCGGRIAHGFLFGPDTHVVIDGEPEPAVEIGGDDVDLCVGCFADRFEEFETDPSHAGYLDDLLDTIGPPVEAGSVDWSMPDRLWDGVDPSRWQKLDPKTQNLLLEYLAAMANWLQTERLSEADLDKIDRLFPRLTAYVETHRPGYVHGLATDHEPRRETWLDDANRLWSRLQQFREE